MRKLKHLVLLWAFTDFVGRVSSALMARPQLGVLSMVEMLFPATPGFQYMMDTMIGFRWAMSLIPFGSA
jgi:hypothetical protein